ncbi:hypothetical protein HPB49_009718 [Dermacentor silvarum]|uniref:Uncharacterized protein n=1 Tax=Dermacentor silvarum TaxID=543639 RepID=A0ACB8CQZ8_DERSI|nr:hypothetical protein HPB49_009718 [Dermacentor silvarum]
MPRLPSEHYKIVIRPRHPINLANIGLAAILEAIQSTAKVDPARAEEEDQIRIHPIKNTITVSTPDRTRAEAYRSLEVLKSLRYNMNLPVATYVPAPDDSIRGVVYEAYTDETDHDFQAELMKKNPDIPIVNARRLGSSRHLVITLAGKKLPATIRFRTKSHFEGNECNDLFWRASYHSQAAELQAAAGKIDEFALPEGPSTLSSLDITPEIYRESC